MAFYLYILRCADGSLYTGHTESLEARLAAHQCGTMAGYTKTRRPVVLAWSTMFPTREEALSAEVQVKRWSRAKKEALIASDWDSLRELAKPPSKRASANGEGPGRAG